MKDRMKRLSILCLSVSLCTGNVYAEDMQVTAENSVELETYAAEAETENVAEEVLQEETVVQETEAQETEEPTEAATEVPEQVETEEPASVETDDPRKVETDSSAEVETDSPEEAETQGETALPEMENTEEPQQETETYEEYSEAENVGEKAKLEAADENGTILKKEELKVPETLTVERETYPVDYMQGVYKINVPADSRVIQIVLPDQKDGEEVSLTRWGGYLTEAALHWYLCPDDPEEDAFIQNGNVYTVNLNQFILKMEDLTMEQLAVYGDLAEDIRYAEVMVTGQGRSELLLIEFEEEDEAESELISEETISEEENTEADTEPELVYETECEAEEDAATLSEIEPAGETVTMSASASQVKQVYNAAGKNLANSAKKVTPTVGSMGGEWEILGLARSGNLDQDVIDNYLANVVSTLKDNNGVLHEKRYTDYSRVGLALTSIGVDVTNVGGYNLLQPLSDYDQTVWQGVNGAIWALIAVDSHGYEFPQAESGKTQNSRDMLVDNILMQELSDGGWDLSGQSADPDITAMAIQALAPYYGTNEDVKKAVDRGIKRLSAIQNNNGSYATYGSETSESCSQVIVALTAMGIDPNTDKRFVKNGRSVLDALLEYANEDGSFRHVLEGEANQIATEQAYYALTAYERFIGGKTRLYDMTDVALQSDKEQAEMVQKMIDAIPEKVKLTDKTQIEAAKAMYDSLSETQKSMVNNYSRLESAEKN